MPSRTAAARRSSSRWVIRCVSVVEAAASAGALEGTAEDGSMLAGSRAAIGDGDSRGACDAATVGAGMMVTTAEGDGVGRRRDGDGDGGGVGLGDGAADRLGEGSGGGGSTLLGELE